MVWYGMPRYPDPKSKGEHIHIVCKPGRETDFRGFKQVCLKDGLDMSDEFYGLMQHWLKKHNWPPGNPQRQIEQFKAPVVPVPAKPPMCPAYNPDQPCRPNMFTESCSLAKKFLCPKGRRGVRVE
jgi:hypothetical protein